MPDQFPEIHTAFCGIKKGTFTAITLKFNIANFHLQIECTGNSTRLYHNTFLFFAQFVEAFYIAFVRFTDYCAEASVVFNTLAFHLHAYQFARKRNLS